LVRGSTTVFRAVPDLLLILLLYYAGSMGLNALMLWLGFEQVHISGPLVVYPGTGAGARLRTLRRFSARLSSPFPMARSKRRGLLA